MAACDKCGAVVTEGTPFCGSCGTSMTAGAGAVAIAAAPSSGLAPNIAGMLAYFTFIPAIIFLVMEPYNKDRFIRFHAFQSLFFNAAWIVLWIAMIFVGIALHVIPVLGILIHLLIDFVLGIGGIILWIILVVKAYGMHKFKLPVIGKMAEDQAAK
jgi:uncharacterized membrane protein